MKTENEAVAAAPDPAAAQAPAVSAAGGTEARSSVAA